MNSKERVLAALNHKQPDRVPSTMSCVDAAWDKLKKYYSVETNEEVMSILEIDTRIMDIPPYNGPKLNSEINNKGEKVYKHPFGYKYIKKWNGIEYNNFTVDHPIQNIKSINDIKAFDQWPNSDHYDYEAVKRFCDKHKDKAIRIGWPGPYQSLLQLFSTEEFYILMISEPDIVKYMLKKWNDFIYELYDRMLKAGDGAIDFLRPCDDYGTQISLLFSPQMWDEYFAENTKRLVDLAHSYGAKYMQHSCGAIRPIIPNMIKCGVDAIEPIQKVVGMEVEGLKADFGDKICFQGGVDTQNLLPYGTPQEVKAESEYIIEIMNKQGGYILAPSQAFEGDVPVKNIIALYEARNKFR